MRPRNLSIAIAMLAVVTLSYGEGRFRSGMFLHHSTGGCIWGPNGGQVTVPSEIASYNAAHNLVGADSVTMTEQW